MYDAKLKLKRTFSSKSLSNSDVRAQLFLAWKKTTAAEEGETVEVEVGGISVSMKIKEEFYASALLYCT